MRTRDKRARRICGPTYKTGPRRSQKKRTQEVRRLAQKRAEKIGNPEMCLESEGTIDEQRDMGGEAKKGVQGNLLIIRAIGQSNGDVCGFV